MSTCMYTRAHTGAHMRRGAHRGTHTGTHTYRGQERQWRHCSLRACAFPPLLPVTLCAVLDIIIKAELGLGEETVLDSGGEAVGTVSALGKGPQMQRVEPAPPSPHLWTR